MAVILITGCSTGIGQEAALALAAAGHTVYASCRNPAGATELTARIAESGLEIPVLALDLLDQGSIDAALTTVIDQQGRIDGLVNNAAIGAGRALEETSLEEIREVYETNVFGSLAVLKAVIPHMRRQGGGRLVCVTSLAATNVFGCHGTYSSSKAAMDAFCMALAQELAEHRVRVSVIAPGCVLTPMWTKGTPPPEDSPYMSSFGRFAKWCEFGLTRAATPADCARAIRSAIEDAEPRFRYPVGLDAEDYWRAYQKVNDPEEWMRIACLDNEAYAQKMAELMGVDYYASTG
jgi:NAD(P)-dependent dehydrogenase (short-subunit alcohol dehydrogenase family)